MAAVAKPALLWPAIWPLSVRIAARRPASWLAAGIACGAAGASHPVAAMAVAAIAVFAAVGEMPPAVGPRLLSGWLAARLAWPLLGLATGFAVTMNGSVGAAPGRAAAVLLAACVASLLTVFMLWAGRRASMTGADTISLAMLTATAAVMAGGLVDAWPVAAVTWILLASLAFWFARWFHGRVDAPLPRSGSDMVAGLISQTPLRRFLGRTAMATMLLAMVGWLLLDPTQARWAAALGVAWMICLALPTVTLQDRSMDGETAWALLLQSTPARRAGLNLLGSGPRMSFESVVRHAAVLGWPSLVAAVVAAGSPTGPWPAVIVGAVIMAIAGVVILVRLACQALGAARDTAFATVLALVAGALLILPTGDPSDVAAFRLDLPDWLD